MLSRVFGSRNIETNRNAKDDTVASQDECSSCRLIGACGCYGISSYLGYYAATRTTRSRRDRALMTVLATGILNCR